MAARLKAAGAVILGKLQLTEGALALHHPDIPPPVNPWRAGPLVGCLLLRFRRRDGGRASATARSAATPAARSDFPSLANGCVGLKPTWGRVSRYGVFPLSETLDHIGPITRRVEDAAAMLGAIAGRDENDPSSSSEPVPNYLAGIGKGLKNVTLGFDEKYCSADVDPAVVATLKKAVSVLKKAGRHRKGRENAVDGGSVAGWVPICAVEAALAHTATYPPRKKATARYSLASSTADARCSGLDYGRAAIARRNLRGADAANFFTDHRHHGRPGHALAQSVRRRVQCPCAESPTAFNKLIHFTCPYDTTGQPTITLPAGLDANGSPLGFQIVGRHFEEGLLCRAGMAWQSAAGGKGAIPPLAA